MTGSVAADADETAQKVLVCTSTTDGEIVREFGLALERFVAVERREPCSPAALSDALKQEWRAVVTSRDLTRAAVAALGPLRIWNFGLVTEQVELFVRGEGEVGRKGKGPSGTSRLIRVGYLEPLSGLEMRSIVRFLYNTEAAQIEVKNYSTEKTMFEALAGDLNARTIDIVGISEDMPEDVQRFRQESRSLRRLPDTIASNVQATNELCGECSGVRIVGRDVRSPEGHARMDVGVVRPEHRRDPGKVSVAYPVILSTQDRIARRDAELGEAVSDAYLIAAEVVLSRQQADCGDKEAAVMFAAYAINAQREDDGDQSKRCAKWAQLRILEQAGISATSGELAASRPSGCSELPAEVGVRSDGRIPSTCQDVREDFADRRGCLYKEAVDALAAAVTGDRSKQSADSIRQALLRLDHLVRRIEDDPLCYLERGMWKGAYEPYLPMSVAITALKRQGR